MDSELARLVAKVDETTGRLVTRAGEALVCAPGCASCCHVELTLTRVEADAIREHLERADASTRARIAARAEADDGRCVMLDPDDRCAIFEARPIVCRTQGLALLYPEDVVPVDAILRKTPRGVITACPLNFRNRAPETDEAIDAERLDAMLGLVNRMYAERLGTDPLERIALRAIARSVR